MHASNREIFCLLITLGLWIVMIYYRWRSISWKTAFELQREQADCYREAAVALQNAFDELRRETSKPNTEVAP